MKSFTFGTSCLQLLGTNLLLLYVGALDKSVFFQNLVTSKLIQRIWSIYKKSFYQHLVVKTVQMLAKKTTKNVFDSRPTRCGISKDT